MNIEFKKPVKIEYYLDILIGGGNGGFRGGDLGIIKPKDLGLDSNASTKQVLREWCAINDLSFKVLSTKSHSLYGVTSMIELTKMIK
tara:strand:+ start:746 stop:1006 length:261 start_codon:yes stop_codon:yes gene_type:complete